MSNPYAVPEFELPGLREVLAAQVKAQHDRIEQACEAALQSGRYGVLIDDVDGTVMASPEVPYGVIHRYPNGRDPELR